MIATDVPTSQKMVLPSVLDLPAAHGLRDSLLDAAASARAVVADGAAVERTGTPAVQVLLAASRTIAANGGKFVLSRPSSVLRSALDDLGVSNEFELSDESL
jgi:anti-anti-sigma regulatory factor